MKMILDSKSLDSLSLDLVKNHLNILHDDDDMLINNYIESSLEVAELYTSKPVTNEIYSAGLDTSYNIKYKPDNVELYLDSVLVETATFDYSFPTLTINSTAEYNNIKATVTARTSASITQARLLTIGSSYMTRENENFANMKATDFSTRFLLDLNEGSWL